MPGIVRRGDVNSKGGKAVGGQGNFKVNNKSAVTSGTPVGKHGRGRHAKAKTGSGVGSFIINGIAANAIGNSDSCGHSRRSGSPDFIIGN